MDPAYDAAYLEDLAGRLYGLVISFSGRLPPDQAQWLHHVAGAGEYGLALEVCRATTRTLALSWSFPCLSGRSSVFADQALDDVGALNSGGHIDRLAGLVQRRSLFPRLVRPVFVIVPRVRGEDLPEVPFAVDQEVVETLTPERSHMTLRTRVCPRRADRKPEAAAPPQ